MKFKHILLPVAVLFFVFAQAQQSVDSAVSRSVNDQKMAVVTKVNGKVADKVSQGIDSFFDHPFGKKAKKNDKDNPENATTFQPGEGKTLITITGTDYPSLSGFSDVLEANAQVKKVDSEFSDGTGTLKVCHSGTVKELLADLVKRTNGRLEVTKAKDGVVSMKTK